MGHDRTDIASLTLTRGRSLAELAALEPVARAVFGAGARPGGWLPRKLRREVIRPALSVIARAGGEVIAYALVGAPPSLPATAWISSVGVRPEARGRGVGRALLEAAAGLAQAAGLARLRVLAEPDRAAFYARLGFAAIDRQQTLLADRWAGPRGPGDALEVGDARDPAPWGIRSTIAVSEWLEEAWERTPAGLRMTLRLGRDGARPLAWAHVSREGAALLVQRLLIASDRGAGLDVDADADTIARRARAAAEGLRAALAGDAPLLLYGLPAVSPITTSLVDAGWRVAQEGVLLGRDLGPAA